MALPLRIVEVAKLKAACSSCSLHELCLPAGLTASELASMDLMIDVRRLVKRGDYVFRSGTPLHALYAIRSGFVKSCVVPLFEILNSFIRKIAVQI